MVMIRSKNHLNLVISSCFLLCFIPPPSMAAHTLSKGQHITQNHSLISKHGIFELGFFTTPSQNIYLGIWYKDFPNTTIVWVANREQPLPKSSSLKLGLVANGNLGLYNDLDDSFWSTNLITALPQSVEAALLDNGNLILRDGSDPNTIFWQSFDHPTHAWLSEAALGFNKITGKMHRLVSWKSIDDPSPGPFSMEISLENPHSILLKWNMSSVYWSSGAWNGAVFPSVPQISYLHGFTFVSFKNGTYVKYSVLNPHVFSMLVLDPSGNFMQLTSLRSMRGWSTVFELPKDELFAFCGEFGVFNANASSKCRCLPGFASLSMKDCSRTSALQCELRDPTLGKKDGFLRISEVKFPADQIQDSAQTAQECSLVCMMRCSCTAYAFSQINGCLIWEGTLFDLKNVSNNREFLHLKLAHSEFPNERKKIREVIVAVVVPTVLVFLGGALGCFYKWKNRQKEGKEHGEDLLSFDFDISKQQQQQQPRKSNTEFDLPMFNYASVSAATNSFSPQNKLGEGGFGPVYKGKLLNGQEVALKRLSKKSGQGFEEFRNEILLIAKLQHRNLVRLLGCCIDTHESILIYEYMPNKSLDFFLFDSDKQELLEWPTRVGIIEGIAQGLLYLHEYSRLRIIHRDLKASNILLDDEMNPKISDFGMARIFGGNDSRAHTNKIVGTFGYMAPEYAMEGLFSIKSDVFSFGVLVLEIISGKKNTGFYQTHCLNLLGHAWELWSSGRGVELVKDGKKAGPGSGSRGLRYINVGLLCVQENPNDRPSMGVVVSMLCSEIAAIPPPKKPAFAAAAVITSSSSNSVNGLTVSDLQPR